MDGSEAMFDSRVIVEYLDTLSPVGKLIPQQSRERAEVKTWEALADGVMDAGVLLAPRSHLGAPRRGRAQPGLDGPPARQGRRRHRRHGQGPGRQALLQRHPPEPVGHRRSAARSAGSSSASPTSTGAATTPTWPSLFTTSSCCAPASPTPNPDRPPPAQRTKAKPRTRGLFRW